MIITIMAVVVMVKRYDTYIDLTLCGVNILCSVKKIGSGKPNGSRISGSNKR